MDNIAAGSSLFYFPRLQDTVKSESCSVYRRSIEMCNFGGETLIIIKGSQKMLDLLPAGFQGKYKIGPLRC